MKFRNITIQIGVVVEPDSEGFHAYCPDLKGLHACGATALEAEENADIAIGAYLASVIKQQRLSAAACDRAQFVTLPEG